MICNDFRGFGPAREKQYIAAQGPTEKTSFQFWQMAVEHKVKVIVMLTRLREKSNKDGSIGNY